MYKCDKEEIFGLIPKNGRGEYFRVARITNGEVDHLDIRTMYTDEAGNVKPTQKGIRVNEEGIVNLVITILEALTVDEFNAAMEPYNDDGEEESNEE